MAAGILPASLLSFRSRPVQISAVQGRQSTHVTATSGNACTASEALTPARPARLFGFEFDLVSSQAGSLLAVLIARVDNCKRKLNFRG